MRHGKKINHLGRTSSHRKAMLSNMAASLILHKRISTTLAKAKALRIYVEPLLTRSKDDSTHNRRMAFSYLQNKEAVTELFREISKKIAERPGGYTRILKTGNRLGDNADMCFIELVDYNETMIATKDTTKAKPTRRRRTTGKKKEDGTEDEVAVTESKETKTKKEPKKEAPAEVVETPMAKVEEAPAAEVATTDQEDTNEEAAETKA
jgi:large subunit ribosomal protein L17